MARNKPTLKELARLAGLSTTTVSDALTGSGRVSAETRQRIEGLANEVGYVPNSAARKLRQGGLGVVGLYLHPMTTDLDYFKVLVMGGFHAAAPRGFDLILIGPRDLVDGRLTARVDGIVISDPLHGDDDMKKLFNSGIPVVTIERPDPELPEPVGTVTADHRAAVWDMLNTFTTRGARRPAFLMTGGRDFPSGWAIDLVDAYEGWCADRACDVAIEWIGFSTPVDEVDVAIDRLFRRFPDMDALFCARDGLVARASGVLAERGYVVGGNFALAAGDDPALLQYFAPPLAAIDLDPAGYVQAAVELLADVLAGIAEPGENRTHTVKFKDRESARLHLINTSDRPTPKGP